MPGNPRDMIISAERRFPVRIRIGVPPGGFGQRYTGAGYKIETAEGVFRVRTDEPAARTTASLHRTP
jgi:hypothetical protein